MGRSRDMPAHPALSPACRPASHALAAPRTRGEHAAAAAAPRFAPGLRLGGRAGHEASTQPNRGEARREGSCPPVRPTSRSKGRSRSSSAARTPNASSRRYAATIPRWRRSSGSRSRRSRRAGLNWRRTSRGRPGMRVLVLERSLGDVDLSAAVRVHDVDLLVAVAVGDEGDLCAVGRPARVPAAFGSSLRCRCRRRLSRRCRWLLRASRGATLTKRIFCPSGDQMALLKVTVLSRCVPSRLRSRRTSQACAPGIPGPGSREGDLLAVGRPGARPSARQPPLSAAVGVHDVDIWSRITGPSSACGGNAEAEEGDRMPSGDQIGCSSASPLRVNLRSPRPSAFMSRSRHDRSRAHIRRDSSRTRSSCRRATRQEGRRAPTRG